MTDRKKTRSVSDETQLRELLLKLTDHVLELKEDNRKNAILIKGRFADLEADVLKVAKQSEKNGRELKAVAILLGDTFRKTVELHVKLIGTSDGLGKRLYDLERARQQRDSRPSRPPRRG